MPFVYPYGQATVTVPANESVAVNTVGKATVSQSLSYPNVPATVSVVGHVNNGQTVFGPYTSGATIIIDAGASQVSYAVGTAPVAADRLPVHVQGAPVAVNTTGAVSSAAMLGGIVTSTTAASVDGTVPTGAVLDAAAELAVDDSFDWSVINTGVTNAFTVTAASGHTLVGEAAVAAETSGRFRTRKSAASTFITYRIG